MDGARVRRVHEHERRLEAHQREWAELSEAAGDERHRRRVGKPDPRAKDFQAERSLQVLRSRRRGTMILATNA